MEAAFFDVLIQNGGLGLFAVYLIYEASRQRKQIDQLTTVISGQSTDFGAQLEKLRSENQEKERVLRDRYDNVIADFQRKESQDRSHVIRQLEALGTRVDSLWNEIDSLGISLSGLQKEFGDIRIREIARTSVKSK